ncbi:MAG TPA: trypsin-like peptidase domain-containing protein [Desulfuromonadales bacterium]
MRRWGLLILLLAIWTPAGTVCAQGDASRLYRQLEAASLEVLVEGRLSGSGWFAASHGLAVTAAHVIKDRGRIEVLSPVAGRLKARLVATDLGHDLALLLVERSGDHFPYLDLASTAPVLGENLYLFGSPLFRHGLLVTGGLAKEETQFEWNDRNHCYTEVHALSAMTPEGFSGGAWVNAKGEVVGVQGGMMSWKGALMGIAFMSPVEPVARLLNDKRTGETISLGAMFSEPWESPAAATTSPEPEGLLVSQLVSGGPLAAAGIQKGDVLLAVNGQRVRYRDQLLRLVRRNQAGTQAMLTIRNREGAVCEVRVELHPRENY